MNKCAYIFITSVYGIYAHCILKIIPWGLLYLSFFFHHHIFVYILYIKKFVLIWYKSMYHVYIELWYFKVMVNSCFCEL